MKIYLAILIALVLSGPARANSLYVTYPFSKSNSHQVASVGGSLEPLEISFSERNSG